MKWIEKRISNYIIAHIDCSIYESSHGGYLETVSVLDDLKVRLKLSPCIQSQDSQNDYIKITCHSKDELHLVNRSNETIYKGEYECSKIEIEMHNQLATHYSIEGTFWASSNTSTIIGFVEINSTQKSESWGLDGELKVKCIEIENQKWKLLVNSIDARLLDLATT